MTNSLETDTVSAAIRHAQAALAQLRAEDAELADSLKSLLPAYALQEERAKHPVTQETLLADARKGPAWFREQRVKWIAKSSRPVKTPLEIYTELVATLPPSESSLFRQFFEACQVGDLKRVKTLHQQGADVTAQNNLAVIYAAANGHLEVVKFLHQQGADVTAQNNLAVIYAAEKGHLEVVKFLHQHGADITTRDNLPMIRGAEKGHLDIIKYLHDNGADITAQDNLAVIHAAGYDHLEIVKYLDQHGADITAQDNTAVIWAAASGHVRVVQFLHQHGADITAQNNRAAIHAAENGHGGVIQFLHQHGADITAQDNMAVMKAARNGHLEVVKFLHQHGASITARDNMAVMNAAGENYWEMVKFLRQHGASLERLNENQRAKYDQYVNGCARWQKVLRRDPPPYIHCEDPTFFKETALTFILPLLKHEGYTGNTAQYMAFNAGGLFQSPARVMQYLRQWGRSSKQPLHDLIHMIKLPQDRGQMNVKDWGDAVLKCGPSMAKLVQFADRVPSPARSRDGKTWSYVSTREICSQFTYAHALEHPELAALCFEHKVDEEDFNKALKIVQKGPPAQKNLPEITIDGEKFDIPGAHFYRLPPNDIRGLFLGELTDCCQSIGAHGAACAKYGYRSENGGFYVVENAKGLVISQTFAWRAQGGGMCFDTLETLGQNVSARQWSLILKEAALELSRRTDHDVVRLTVGMGGDTPDSLQSIFNKASSPAKPLDYTGYSEAAKQIEIWERPSTLRPS